LDGLGYAAICAKKDPGCIPDLHEKPHVFILEALLHVNV